MDAGDEQLVIDALLRRVSKGLAVLVATRGDAMLAVVDRIVTLDRPTEPTTWQWDAIVPTVVPTVFPTVFPTAA